MSEYETVPIELQFECTHAVYKKNSNSSLCYVTSKERGEFIEKALKAQKRVEELEARTITIDMLKRCKDDDAWMFASNLNAMLQGDRQ